MSVVGFLCDDILKVCMIDYDCYPMLHHFQAVTPVFPVSTNRKHFLVMNVLLPLHFLNLISERCYQVKYLAVQLEDNT